VEGPSFFFSPSLSLDLFSPQQNEKKKKRAAVAFQRFSRFSLPPSLRFSFVIMNAVVMRSARTVRTSTGLLRR